eukprot:14050273-Heterocapsa_arctica.AAC.1
MPVSICASLSLSMWTHDCLGGTSLSPKPWPGVMWAWLKGLSCSAVGTRCPQTSSPRLLAPESFATGSAGMKKHP